MKLAQALLLRADLKHKQVSLREPIARNAMVQEGKCRKSRWRHCWQKRIRCCWNCSNWYAASTRRMKCQKISVARVLSDMLALRDRLIEHHALLVSTIATTHKDVDRYSPREIKWVPQVQVASLQKQADDLSRKIRETNALVQAANWQIDIVV